MRNLNGSFVWREIKHLINFVYPTPDLIGIAKIGGTASLLNGYVISLFLKDLNDFKVHNRFFVDLQTINSSFHLNFRILFR